MATRTLSQRVVSILRINLRYLKRMRNMRLLIGMLVVIIPLLALIIADILLTLGKHFLQVIRRCLIDVWNLSLKLRKINVLLVLLVPLSLLSILFTVNHLICNPGSMIGNILCSLLLLVSLAFLCLLKRMK